MVIFIKYDVWVNFWKPWMMNFHQIPELEKAENHRISGDFKRK